MAAYVRSKITWFVLPRANDMVASVRALLGDGYAEDVRALQDFLCCYFSGEHGCTAKQGGTISPLGATESGGKILKVRWHYPGCGKRGGLRLGFVAYCDARKVVLCNATQRRDVSGDEALEGTAEADQYLDDEDEASG